MQTQNIHGTDLSKRYRRSSCEQIWQGHLHGDVDDRHPRRTEEGSHSHAARQDTTRTEFGVEKVEHFDSGIIAEAVRYVVKYRLVSIAEKTPVQSCPCNRNGSRLRHGTRTITAYRSVSLTKRYISGAREADHEELDKEGKHIATVHVPGFIRQQAYGKQWSEHRTIWVDGFERGQWIRDGVIIRRVNK